MGVTQSNTQQFTWQWRQFIKLTLKNLEIKHCRSSNLILGVLTKIQGQIPRSEIKFFGNNHVIKTNQGKVAWC